MRYKFLPLFSLLLLAGAVERPDAIQGKYVIDVKAFRSEARAYHWLNLGKSDTPRSRENDAKILEALCQMIGSVSLEIRRDGTYSFHTLGGDFGGTYKLTKTGIAASAAMLPAAVGGGHRMKLSTFYLCRVGTELRFVDDHDPKISVPIERADDSGAGNR